MTIIYSQKQDWDYSGEVCLIRMWCEGQMPVKARENKAGQNIPILAHILYQNDRNGVGTVLISWNGIPKTSFQSSILSSPSIG